MTDTQDVVEVYYRGYINESGGRVIATETPDGETVGVLRHYVKHSPDGFSWGFAGSGPADTARSLLLAALADNRCLECNGTTKVMFDAADSAKERPFDPGTDDPDSELLFQCHVCDDGLAAVPYQDFKFQVVARWDGDEGWRMSRTEILLWLEQHARGTGQ
jgi:hypothetical protein